MATHPRLVPYPPLQRHGLIGDRRTAGLVAADGTIDWLCLPAWDGEPALAALLDSRRGGHFRLGPHALRFAQQRYLAGTGVLTSRWSLAEADLELTDAMTLTSSPDEHVLVRRLACLRGETACELTFAPRDEASGLKLWATHRGRFTLRRGEVAWAVLDTGPASRWSPERAARELEQTAAAWREWMQRVRVSGPRAGALHHSAVLVHLLDSGPYGSLVAAPTTSLPERIGGSWQADYRFAWVRDASLACRCLTTLHDLDGAKRYLDWLVQRGPHLRPMYAIDGQRAARQRKLKGLHGHRGSRPVRVGNNAYQQRQPGALGFLADCVLVYLERGGRWRDSYWRLLSAVADDVAETWQRADNGIWELWKAKHYVSSRVMSWVALDRALRVAARLGERPGARWAKAARSIRREVLQRGYSEKLGAFRQSYEDESLDAALLLVPLMGFLSPDDRRTVATVERIASELTIDGFVYRFDPNSVRDLSSLPMGEAEGAFLPCTFWLVAAWAQLGRLREATALLERAEAIAAPLGLFAEGVDPRTRSFLGNGPLLFSQVEYVRAVQELDRARRTGVALAA